MRITFVVPLLEASGGARIIAGHAQRLATKGHEVTVVSKRQVLSLRQKASIFLGHSVPLLSPNRSHVALAGIPFKIAARRGPVTQWDVPDADVIVATWWETAEWISKMPRAKGTKVHFIQGYEAFPGIPTELVDAAWQLPTTKIAVAQWLVDLGRERFGIEEIALVPNSVDSSFLGTEARSMSTSPTVGFLFHNAVSKDVPTSLAAIKRLKQLQPNVHIVSFGSVKPRPGEIPNYVEFYHLPSQEEIANIYARCNAWLSTSRSEGFNLPPLEAMASGCPAVCAKTGRPLEVIESGVNGYLVEQGDVVGFTDALVRIVSLPDREWRQMSDAARRSVAYPTWDESNELFYNALVQSLKNDGRSDWDGCL